LHMACVLVPESPVRFKSGPPDSIAKHECKWK